VFTAVGLPPRGGSRMAGTSRTSREAHVRICGGPEVKSFRSTRPANSGRSGCNIVDWESKGILTSVDQWWSLLSSKGAGIVSFLRDGSHFGAVTG
jgi:hypothetical protein